MPKQIYHAYGYVKKAAALVNAAAGRLPEWKKQAIVRAAEEAIAGSLTSTFLSLSGRRDRAPRAT